MCESRGGRPGLPVPNSPSGLCGRKATTEEEYDRKTTICVKVEVDVPGLIVPNSPYGLCGRQSTVSVKKNMTQLERG